MQRRAILPLDDLPWLVFTAFATAAIAVAFWIEPAPLGALVGASLLLVGGVLAQGAARRIRDVTRALASHAHEVARSQQASEVKSRFLANMSHEMRTPLNGVLGLADVLSRRPIDPTSAELVRTIGRSARTLLALVNDILDLSRVESGQLELEHEELDPEGAARAVCDMLLPQARTKGIDLVLSVATDVPDRVLGDALRFEQVLTNVVGNAVKFTSHGWVKVSLAWRAGELETTVTDTGVGIPPQKLESIFEAFAQADTSTTRRFGGSGLGLTIARRLARRMGGELAVDSRLDKGSTFVFRVPFPIAAPATATPELDRPTGDAVIVCEAPATRALLVDHASRAGLVPVPLDADDLVSALLAQPPPAVVLWDARVAEPAMLGEALARAVHEQGVRVVVHSALGDDAALSRLPRSIVLQPFTREQFHRALGAPHVHTAPTVRPPAAPIRRLRGRVLVAEDDETNRVVLASYARELGIQAELVHDGVEAVIRAMTGPEYDVILMDCQMPKLDGYEATRRIRAFEAESARRRTPIIAVTAHALATERARALALGMDGYLTKPLTLEALRATLLEHVLPDEPGGTAPAGPTEPLSGAARIQDPRTLERLAESFLRGSSEALAGLAEALERRDAITAIQHAHKLKGSCAALGADDARALAEELESLSRAGRVAEGAPVLVALEVAVAETQADLEALACARAG